MRIGPHDHAIGDLRYDGRKASRRIKTLHEVSPAPVRMSNYEFACRKSFERKRQKGKA